MVPVQCRVPRYIGARRGLGVKCHLQDLQRRLQIMTIPSATATPAAIAVAATEYVRVYTAPTAPMQAVISSESIARTGPPVRTSSRRRL
jgi:hypothetical protein